MDNKYLADVTRVVDGDTFDCFVHLGFDTIQKFRVRLYGVDTPEINKKDEREKGLEVKEIVKNKIEGKQIYLYEQNNKDKFGRALARVELMDGTDLTEWLLQEGLGKEYYGGKKLLASLAIIR